MTVHSLPLEAMAIRLTPNDRSQPWYRLLQHLFNPDFALILISMHCANIAAMLPIRHNFHSWSAAPINSSFSRSPYLQSILHPDFHFPFPNANWSISFQNQWVARRNNVSSYNWLHKNCYALRSAVSITTSCSSSRFLISSIRLLIASCKSMKSFGPLILPFAPTMQIMVFLLKYHCLYAVFFSPWFLVLISLLLIAFQFLVIRASLLSVHMNKCSERGRVAIPSDYFIQNHIATAHNPSA